MLTGFCLRISETGVLYVLIEFLPQISKHILVIFFGDAQVAPKIVFNK